MAVSLYLSITILNVNGPNSLSKRQSGKVDKISNSINTIHDKRKVKNMIISRDAEKVFDKIQHPFMITTFTKVSIEGTYQNNKSHL